MLIALVVHDLFQWLKFAPNASKSLSCSGSTIRG